MSQQPLPANDVSRLINLSHDFGSLDPKARAEAILRADAIFRYHGLSWAELFEEQFLLPAAPPAPPPAQSAMFPLPQKPTKPAPQGTARTDLETTLEQIAYCRRFAKLFKSKDLKLLDDVENYATAHRVGATFKQQLWIDNLYKQIRSKGG